MENISNKYVFVDDLKLTEGDTVTFLHSFTDDDGKEWEEEEKCILAYYIDDSKKVIEFLGIKGIEINIGGTYNELRSEINKQYPGVPFPSLFTTNTPARLRMTTLYGIAAMFGGVVCNTCNLSEDWIGYSTKWGDAVGDFSLLNCLTKSEVVALGDTIGLPYELIHKVPSDGMCGKTDEDNLGFSYDELDAYIRSQPKYNINSEYDSNPNLLSGVVEKIEKMHFAPNTKKKCSNFSVFAKENINSGWITENL